MTDGADPQAIGSYLASALAEPAWSQCRTELISGGKSNLTYAVTSPAGSVVLRRPPLGQLLPTAHDMVREATVIAALAPTPVPVPKVLAVCTDTEVLGAPFYLMSRVDGLVCRERFPTGYADQPEQRARIAEALITTLADLHAVDIEAVGLAGFGRPDGYLTRQIRRWSAQWEASRSEAMPELDQLGTDLAAAVPESGPASIVHGDYRLDNTMLDPHQPGRIVAVLDWEMSTLGDPLADLGLLLCYWSQPGEAHRPAVVTSLTDLPGFPTREQVAADYAERTGRELSGLAWYVAFSYFKLAVVVQGILTRVSTGAMAGQSFAGYDDLVGALVGTGRELLASGSLG